MKRNPRKPAPSVAAPKREKRRHPKYQWTPAKYRSVVKGDDKNNLPGLREIVEGFEARDGFDLRLKKWSTWLRLAVLRGIFL